MLRSAPVKEPLKAPFILLFIILCTTVILSALNVLYTWGMFDSANGRFSLAYVVQRFPRSMFEMLIPSVVLSIVLLGLRMARQAFLPLSSGLVIVLGVSYVVLVNGMIWLRAAQRRKPRRPTAVPRAVHPARHVRQAGARA